MSGALSKKIRMRCLERAAYVRVDQNFERNHSWRTRSWKLPYHDLLKTIMPLNWKRVGRSILKVTRTASSTTTLHLCQIHCIIIFFHWKLLFTVARNLRATISTRILARLIFSSSKYCRHRKCYSFKNCVALLRWFRDCHFDGSVSSNARYVTWSHGPHETDCHAESSAGRV